MTVTVDASGGAGSGAVAGWAVTVTVFVTVDAVGLTLSPPGPMLPHIPNRRTPPMTLPTMIKVRLLDRGLGEGCPHSRPFQYACPPAPVGSGYQPGVGDGCVVKTSPGDRPAVVGRGDPRSRNTLANASAELRIDAMCLWKVC